jgi:hypothetical protein
MCVIRDKLLMKVTYPYESSELLLVSRCWITEDDLYPVHVRQQSFAAYYMSQKFNLPFAKSAFIRVYCEPCCGEYIQHGV